MSPASIPSQVCSKVVLSAAAAGITQLAHHGIVFVPLGYTEPTGLQFGLDEPQGGSAYGAGTFAGPTGARQVPQPFSLLLWFSLLTLQSLPQQRWRAL